MNSKKLKVKKECMMTFLKCSIILKNMKFFMVYNWGQMFSHIYIYIMNRFKINRVCVCQPVCVYLHVW